MVLRRHFCYYFGSCFYFGAIVCLFIKTGSTLTVLPRQVFNFWLKGFYKDSEPHEYLGVQLKKIIFIDVLIMKYFRCLKIHGLLNMCPISFILISNAKFCNVNTYYSKECTINKQIHRSDSQPRLRTPGPSAFTASLPSTHLERQFLNPFDSLCHCMNIPSSLCALAVTATPPSQRSTSSEMHLLQKKHHSREPLQTILLSFTVLPVLVCRAGLLPHTFLIFSHLSIEATFLHTKILNSLNSY